MSETAEVQAKAEGVSSPELTQAIKEAQVEVRRDMERAAHQAAVPAGEAGFLSALWKAAEPHVKNAWGVHWKELKTQGMAALSLIPFLGHGAELASKVAAAQQASKGANVVEAEGIVREVLERGLLSAKQRKIYEAAIGAGKGPVEALIYAQQGAITDSTRKRVGFEVKERVRHGAIHSALAFIDPFPNVPRQLHEATALVSLMGYLPIPGAQAAFAANLLPVAWQYFHNKYEMVREGLGMARDVGAVIGREFYTMLDNAKKPEVAHAAAAFHHA